MEDPDPPRPPIPHSPVSTPVSSSRATWRFGTLGTRNVGPECQLYNSGSSSQQKEFHAMGSDALIRDVGQRYYPVASGSSSSPVQVLGASGYDGRHSYSGVVGDVPCPVRSTELPSRSQFIWTPDDFVRNTPERQCANMEEVQLLLGLREERRFSESGYQRDPMTTYTSVGPDFSDSKLLRSVSLDQDDDEQSDTIRACPTLQYRLVSDGDRPNDFGSSQQNADDVSHGGLLHGGNDIQVNRSSVELSGTRADCRTDSYF